MCICFEIYLIEVTPGWVELENFVISYQIDVGFWWLPSLGIQCEGIRFESQLAHDHDTSSIHGTGTPSITSALRRYLRASTRPHTCKSWWSLVCNLSISCSFFFFSCLNWVSRADISEVRRFDFSCSDFNFFFTPTRNSQHSCLIQFFGH